MSDAAREPEHGHRQVSDLDSSVELARAVESYRTYLTAIARASLGPGLNAKVGPSDLVQETFLAARRTVGDFKGRSAADMKVWLKSILLHLVSNTRRYYQAVDRRRVDLEIPLDLGAIQLEDAATSVAGRAIRNERDAAMAAALTQLPEHHRRILERHIREGKTFAEIGQELGISEGAARQQWMRALQRLRQTLESLT